jgi:sugar O-acyltransferase (sialic acid O-acetyltransferase NeuD family)
VDRQAKRFLVVGAGGHGRVVADLVRALGHSVAGFVDDDPAKIDSAVDSTGSRVTITLQTLLRYVDANGELPAAADHVALAIGGNARRLELFTQLRRHCAPALIHPSAVVSPTAYVGDGSVVFAASAINSEARAGCAAIINTGAIVEHDCTVHDGVHLSPGAVLCGTVSVGARSWIGAASVVIQGRCVGSDAIVGAGAVVVHDVPDGVVVFGNPARVQDPRINDTAGSRQGAYRPATH